MEEEVHLFLIVFLFNIMLQKDIKLEVSNILMYMILVIKIILKLKNIDKGKFKSALPNSIKLS